MDSQLLFFLLPLFFCVHVQWIAIFGEAAVGVNFGSNRGAESSRSAEALVQMLRSNGIRRIRLPGADSAVLRALGSSSSSEESIEVIVGVLNDEIVDIGVSRVSARNWVSRNVVPFFPLTKIVAIAVGCEVLASDDHGVVPFLVPAMRNIHSTLSEYGFDREIKVSSPQSVLSPSSYFPSSSTAFIGYYRRRVMAPLLDFLESTESYFMLNMNPRDYPRAGMKELPLDYALFSSSLGKNDPRTGLHYNFDPVIDAVLVAMALLGHKELKIVVIETGMFRRCLSSEVGIAAMYKANPTDHLSRGVGTSLKPQVEINTYLVDLPMRKDSPAFTSRRLVEILEVEPVANTRRNLADKSWCVANTNADTTTLQTALDWACGSGVADCGPIQAGQSCFLPNTIVAHASYAFNSYYQAKSWATGSCSFDGLAHTTTTDPSNGSCLYASSTSANGSPGTPTGTTVPSPSSGFKWDHRHFALTSFVLAFLLNLALLDFKF